MRLIDLNKIPHKAFRGDRDDLVDALFAAPTVDAVAVVRCKDCRHRDPEDHKCDCGEMERQGCLFRVDDDYYCAYGERKGGDE